MIALNSLVYLEEDGLLLSIALLAAIVLTVALVSVRETVLGAKWISGRRVEKPAR